MSANSDNPIEHHTTVLAHMAEIAKNEFDKGRFNLDQVKQALAVAILHDICPVRKITEGMIKEASPEQLYNLKRERDSSVLVHMEKGAEMARKKLLGLNKSFMREVFKEQEIDLICNVILIHDNPKRNLKIPKNNSMAVMLREADRLWMVTLEGVCADLDRSHKDPKDYKAQFKQVVKNMKRFKEERKLYCDQDGPFCDDVLFFRNPTAKNIFDILHSCWSKECRFCVNFEIDYDIELVLFYCRKGCFTGADDGNFADQAPFCQDFILDNRPESRWTKISPVENLYDEYLVCSSIL